jgi:hypothetical protein
MCGDLCGDMWGTPGRQKPCQACNEMPVCLAGLRACRSGNAFVWLYQIQLCCPFDGRPAISDVEFTVDALGMCADRAQGDH